MWQWWFATQKAGNFCTRTWTLTNSGYYNLYGIYSLGDVGTGVPIFLSSHASLACLRTGFISTTFTCASQKGDADVNRERSVRYLSTKRKHFIWYSAAWGKETEKSRRETCQRIGCNRRIWLIKLQRFVNKHMQCIWYVTVRESAVLAICSIVIST